MPDEIKFQPGSGEVLLPGSTLLGVYEILGFLGGGGMGRVYRAQHNQLGVLRAIKVIRPDMTYGSNVKQQFIREARVLMEINHDAVARCHELLSDSEGCLYLVMELVEGPSLETVIQSGPLDTQAVRALWQRIAEGLAAIHAKGIVHRDISPGNIVFPEGRPEKAKLIDFGVASLAAAETIGIGEFKGKLAYASPEQLGQYGGKVEGKSDIYTFGLVLAEAASGAKTYRTPYETRIPPNVPAELREDILKLLEPDPALRPATAFPPPLKVVKEQAKTATIPAVTPKAPTNVQPMHVQPDDVPRRAFSAGKLALVALLLCGIGLGAWALLRKNLAIVGNGVDDRLTHKNDPPGDVRAFDVSTGKRVSGTAPKETVATSNAPSTSVPVTPKQDDVTKSAPPKEPVTPANTPAQPVPETHQPIVGKKSAPPKETVVTATKQPGTIYAPAPDDAKKTAAKENAVAPVPPPVVKSGRHLGDSKINPRDELKYIWIPPGTFTMGCSPGDSECFDDEKPAHQVTISKGFWLGQTDVTQAAYQRVTGSNPSKVKESNLPVNEVSWDSARTYCQEIGGRLPTEAEWEYAARAGSTASRYGNLDAIAWYAGNSGARPHEVGQKQPNAFNLYDMLGNVWQWTADWHGEKYYQTSEARDPAGPPSGTLRTLRGGSWVYDAKRVRASYRHRFEPSHISDSIGFRCAGN